MRYALSSLFKTSLRALRIACRSHLTGIAPILWRLRRHSAAMWIMPNCEDLRQAHWEGCGDALQPARMHRIGTKIIAGDPDMDHVSTSYIERSNLSIRM